jgi:hypothetical protein
VIFDVHIMCHVPVEIQSLASFDIVVHMTKWRKSIQPMYMKEVKQDCCRNKVTNLYLL